MRFHLDERVAKAVADGLRRRGLDVTTADDAGLLSAPDEEHLQYALAEGRVLVTHDADFLSLAATGAIHLGIAYCRPGVHRVGYIVRRLELLHDLLAADEMAGKIEFL